MEIITKNVKFFGNFLQIKVNKNEMFGDLEELLKNEKELRITIKEFHPKRSLSANAALWVICDHISKKLNTTAWEIYIQELIRYGVSEWIAVLPEAVSQIKKVYRVVHDRGECEIRGIALRRLQVWRGSSTYDTPEMQKLLEGAINDAKEVGADFISKKDIVWKEEKNE